MILGVKLLSRRPGPARSFIIRVHRNVGHALEQTVPGFWRSQLALHTFLLGRDALDNGDLGAAQRAFEFGTDLEPDGDNAFYAVLTKRLSTLKAEAEDSARRILEGQGDKRFLVFSAVVWGDEYIDNFMGYTVRSMLAPGNLPALQDCAAHMSIITTPSGVERIKNSRSFASLRRYAEVHFFTFPEEFTAPFHYSRPNFHLYRLYGALDHTSIHFARALGASIFFIVVDGILSSNTLSTLRRYLDQGYDICANASIVSNRETFLPALDELYGEAEAIDIPARKLANLGMAHRHHYISQRLVIRENRNFDKHPRELYFPTAEGLIVHALYQHPLVISAAAIGQDVQFDYGNVDAKLMARIFDDPRDFPRLKVITDSDEAYVANFAPRSRVFATTGRPLNTRDFVAAHVWSAPIHHYIWRHRQLIRCDTSLRTHRDPEKTAAELLSALVAKQKKARRIE